MLIFQGLWFVWFTFASIAWPRYAFPALALNTVLAGGLIVAIVHAVPALVERISTYRGNTPRTAQIAVAVGAAVVILASAFVQLRPVVTQDSGFDRWLPTGEGLFSFRTMDDAADALNAIGREYPRHSAAARRVAEEYFDARRVLSELLDAVM